MKKRSNEDLREVYEKAHADPSFWTFPTDDITEAVVKSMDWSGRTVLEIGCGTGLTSRKIANAGSGAVVGFDYSEEAINQAIERVCEYEDQQHILLPCSYAVGSIPDDRQHGFYDVVLAQEVIEHTDDPLQSIKDWSAFVKPGGHLLMTCPSFLNARGIVWMTLQMLLDVPMSLTDLHFINPWDMAAWAQEAGMIMVSMRSLRPEVGHGDNLREDMRKRLNNALADWPETQGITPWREFRRDEFHPAVDTFLDWLERAVPLISHGPLCGAGAMYLMRKPE